MKTAYATDTNAPAVVTIAAVADRRNVIEKISYSYNAAPTGGSLSVTDGGTTIFSVDISTDREEFVDIYLSGSVNSEVIATLAAGGASVVGKLNVSYDTL